MASVDRCSAVTPHTCTVFVVFGLQRHTSITESVKKYRCCVFCVSSCWCAQTSACVPTDVTLLHHHGVRILGGKAHKSQRLAETSSFSDSRWQKWCHTLTRCIDCSPVVSAMMGWSTLNNPDLDSIPISGTCEDADCMLTTFADCARHIKIM